MGREGKGGSQFSNAIGLSDKRFTFIHIVFKPSPSCVHLSIVECEWSLPRKLWEDEVIELSLELQGATSSPIY